MSYTSRKQFNPIARTFWSDPKVRDWESDDRELALYLLTNPQRTLEGFYHLSIGQMADDLQSSTDYLRQALKRLICDDFIDYDEPARAVLIVKALKYAGPITTEREINAALGDLERVQGSPRLFGRFLAAADERRPKLAAAIRAHYGLPNGPYLPCKQSACPEAEAEAES